MIMVTGNMLSKAELPVSESWELQGTEPEFNLSQQLYRVGESGKATMVWKRVPELDKPKSIDSKLHKESLQQLGPDLTD